MVKDRRIKVELIILKVFILLTIFEMIEDEISVFIRLFHKICTNL